MSLEKNEQNVQSFIQILNNAAFQLNFISDCNEAISQTLSILGNELEIDRISIFENNIFENKAVSGTEKFTYSKSKKNEEKRNIIFSEYNIERWFERMQNGEPLSVNHKDCLQEECTYFIKNKVETVLFVPIFIKDNFWGYITFECLKQAYSWSENEENLLYNFSFTIGSRIQRDQNEATISFLKTVIEGVPNPLFVKDHNHKWVIMSDSNKRLIGINGEPYIGKSDYDYFPKEQADIFWETDNEVFTNASESYNEEFISDAKTGETQKVITRKKAITTKEGKKYIVGTISEIIESKITKDALAREEYLLNALMENIPDHIYFKDTQSRFIRINHAFKEKYGSDAMTKLIGKSDFDLFTKEHARQAYIDEQRIIRTGKPLIGIEEKETLKTGRVRWVSTTKLPLYDSEGQIVGTFGISRDFTDKKMADLEIQEKSQILNGIITNLPVIAYKLDSRGLFTESIGKGLQNMGFEDKALINKCIYDVFPEETDGIKKAYEQDFSISISHGINGDKEFYFENYLFKDTSEKAGLIGFALEITDKIKSEQKLKEYALSLEKINKELDQFAYVVSHDLKAPLRAITNLSEWIEEDLNEKLDGDTRKNMELLRGRVQRMQSLINGILDYSRVSRTRSTYEDVNIKNLLTDLLSILDVPENFTVTTNLEINNIIGNRTRLEQVFSNLISNAVKYHNKPNGNIEIEIKDCKDHYDFSVKDDGPGIAPEYHEKIFVIFQTLESRDKVESTGVGLAIVKKIVEEEGGTIGIESNIGQGAKFIFTLPKITKR